MKHSKLVVVFTVLMLGVISVVAGLALYTNHAGNASVAALPSVLAYLPSDLQVVFGMNVQKFITSPIYYRFQEKHDQPIGTELAEFIEKTGVDPRRDLFYLLAAGRSKAIEKGEGVAIAVGNFDREAIASYIRSKMVPIEFDYEGVYILMLPKAEGENNERGIAFLSEQEIVLGDLEFIKEIMDVRNKGNKSILSNSTLAPLLNSFTSDEMFWFAGDVAGILASIPVSNPFGESITAIQNVTGTLNLMDSVTGNITVIARDVESATKLVEVVRGFIALGQLAGDQHADLSTLFEGVIISQNETQVNLSLNFSIELLEKLGQVKQQSL